MTHVIKWAIVAAAVSAAALANAQQRIAINLNSHSEVEINRSAAAVWPHIMEPNSWKPDRQLVHYAGPEGQLGEVFAIGGSAAAGKIWFFAENVEIVPNHRRTIKLYDPEGRLLGYSTWLLTESHGRTHVDYDVHAESLLSAEKAKEATSESIAAQQREGYDVNKKRIDAELDALKRLMEAK